jgi:hypothetical protein
MMIMHAIREADAAFEVYELLHAYVEAVRLDRETCHLSPPPAGGPISGMEDLMQQIKALVHALESASRRLDDHSRTIIKEVLYVFCMAADHLDSLHKLARQPIPPVHVEAVHRVATIGVVPARSESCGSRSDNVPCSSGNAQHQREEAARFLTF